MTLYERIRQLDYKNMTAYQIAQELDVYDNSVRIALKAAGDTCRKARNTPVMSQEEVYKKVREILKKKPVGYQKLAVMLGIYPDRVQTALGVMYDAYEEDDGSIKLIGVYYD